MVGNAADMAVRPRDCPKCGEPLCFADKLWDPGTRSVFRIYVCSSGHQTWIVEEC
jgi:hypothetical protein